jgi:hypothetical protein
MSALQDRENATAPYQMRFGNSGSNIDLLDEAFSETCGLNILDRNTAISAFFPLRTTATQRTIGRAIFPGVAIDQRSSSCTCII